MVRVVDREVKRKRGRTLELAIDEYWGGLLRKKGGDDYA
jgi:hypothetical protein